MSYAGGYRPTEPLDRRVLLSAIRLPGRLDVDETAGLLGFAAHDIPILVKAGLLTVLGKPAPNAPKYFAGVEVEQRRVDRQWLDRATRVLAAHWRGKRERRGPTVTVGRRPRTVAPPVREPAAARG